MGFRGSKTLIRGLCTLLFNFRKEGKLVNKLNSNNNIAEAQAIYLTNSRLDSLRNSYKG